MTKKQTKKEVELVVFDWAGTTVDYGSCAPMIVFEKIFKEAGVTLTRAEINGPMGMEKKAHIRSLLSLESANKQWTDKYGRDWTEEDVEQLYDKFEDTLETVVAEYSKPIDGVVDTVKALKEAGIKVGSTTGYNERMMQHVVPAAAKAGYEPDCVVTPDITGVGRPTPFMMNECMRQLGVYPPSVVVKVGDTITDIKEGKNGGAWSIGILKASNLLGMTEEEYNAMDADALQAKKKETEEKYMEAGADYVIDDITKLPEAIAKINAQLTK